LYVQAVVLRDRVVEVVFPKVNVLRVLVNPKPETVTVIPSGPWKGDRVMPTLETVTVTQELVVVQELVP
jgi:hypothetical protein